MNLEQLITFAIWVNACVNQGLVEKPVQSVFLDFLDFQIVKVSGIQYDFICKISNLYYENFYIVFIRSPRALGDLKISKVSK